MPPQIRMSELRAGLASGKITDDDVTQLKAAGYGVMDDESGAPASKQVQPAPLPADSSPDQKHNFAGVNYSFDPGARGDEAAPSESMADRAPGYAKQATKNLAEAGIGGGKGAVGSVYHVYRGLYNMWKGQPADTPLNPDFEKALEGENPSQKAGKVGEAVAEFALGDAAAKTVLEAGKAIPLVGDAMNAAPKLVKAAGEIAKDATVSGTVTAANTGDPQQAKSAAMWGALLPAGLKVAGAGVRRLGLASEASIIRASAKDARDGFAPETIEKYDLGGTLRQTAEKTTAKLNDLSSQLHQTLGSANRHVDLLEAIDETAKQLGVNKAKNFGQNARIRSALNELKQEALEAADNVFIDPTTGEATSATVSLPNANDIKRAVGNRGAWEYGKRDDGGAMQTVSNSLYTTLRKKIEDAAPEVAEINKQIGELIPVEHAVIRRIPIEERQNVLSLGDLVALTHGNVGLYAAKHALRSGVVASGAMKAGAGAVRNARAITNATVATANQGGQ